MLSREFKGEPVDATWQNIQDAPYHQGDGETVEDTKSQENGDEEFDFLPSWLDTDQLSSGEERALEYIVRFPDLDIEELSSQLEDELRVDNPFTSKESLLDNPYTDKQLSIIREALFGDIPTMEDVAEGADATPEYVDSVVKDRLPGWKEEICEGWASTEDEQTVEEEAEELVEEMEDALEVEEEVDYLETLDDEDESEDDSDPIWGDPTVGGIPISGSKAVTDPGPRTHSNRVVEDIEFSEDDWFEVVRALITSEVALHDELAREIIRANAI